jgi:hypothetical protein
MAERVPHAEAVGVFDTEADVVAVLDRPVLTENRGETEIVGLPDIDLLARAERL